MRPLRATVAVLGGFATPIVHATTFYKSSPLITPRESQQCAARHSSSSSSSSNSSAAGTIVPPSAQDPFVFRIAASFTAKGRRFDPKRDVYSFDNFASRQTSSSLPSSSKKSSNKNTGRSRSGEDAFFVSSVGRSDNVAFGVADGVGGWRDSGVDPAEFSHGLCGYMYDRASSATEGSEDFVRPGALLQGGYNDVERDPSVAAGGSTACIAVGRSDGHLEVANLGDSGFVQLRSNAIEYSSDPQTHAFNTPYQLSIIPPQILARSRAFGGEPFHDYPIDASVTQHTVEHGDVLVFASDGVWDNLSAGDVLSIVGRYMNSLGGWVTAAGATPGGKRGSSNGGGSSSVGSGSTGAINPARDLERLTEAGEGVRETIQAAIAAGVAGEAKLASVDMKRDGPFAKSVHMYYPDEDFRGGKQDDICVIVAVVVSQSV